MSNSVVHLTIIGFGKLGKALGNRLSIKPEVKIKAWDIVPTGDGRQVSNILEAAQNASIIFLAVPSSNFANSIKSLGILDKEVILVSFTKGIDAQTGKLPYEIISQTYPHNTLGVVSGPMLSDELEKGLPTLASIATNDPQKIGSIINLFDGAGLGLEISEDLAGVSLLGILKNIYSLGLGLCDGLGLGSNCKSCLTLLALREMASVTQELGGKRESIWSPAGIADFLTTGYSEQSRNYTYGFKKAQNLDLSGIMSEGIVNLERIFKKLKRGGQEVFDTNEGELKNANGYPFLNVLNEIFLRDADPKTSLTNLIFQKMKKTIVLNV